MYRSAMVGPWQSTAARGSTMTGLRIQALSRRAWLALSPGERCAILEGVWPDTDLRLVDAPARWEVVVAAPGTQAPGEAGHRLMVLEELLRRSLGLPIELYSPSVGDLSKLRQKLQKERGREVDDWFSRREETKNLGRRT